MAFSDIIDTALPDGADDPAEADNNMRRIQGGFQELMDVDHLFAKTGTEISDAESGEHRKITVRTLTAVQVAALSATKAYLYRLVTDGELYFKDASNNTIKLSVGGILNSLNLTGDQTVVGDKIFGGVIVLGDTSALGTSAAPVEDEGIANKKYVDDNKPIGDNPTLNDSESNAMLVAHAYLTQTAGFVGVTRFNQSSVVRVSGYVGTTTDPAGAGLLVANDRDDGADDESGLNFFVAKGKYFEIVHSGGGTSTINWTPLISGGGAPIDQD